MTTADFIIALFYRIDNQMTNVPKHSQAALHPSEVVTLGVLYALKGGSKRAFYRWLVRDWRAFFPRLPERTRLFRLWAAHPDWIDAFRAQPTTLGVIDSYGIELLHPVREGRSAQPLGKKGLSNRRWIIGGKLCLVVNQWGLIVDWACNTANVHDSVFHPMIRRFQQQMILLGDQGFHAREGDPSNLKICPAKTWGERMIIETVFSMLTRVSGFKRQTHRAWAYFNAHLSLAMAAFNLLVGWHGVQPDEKGFVKLSIAEFSL